MNQFNPDYLTSVFELHLESRHVSFKEIMLTLCLCLNGLDIKCPFICTKCQ